jgi:hypothetical protein
VAENLTLVRGDDMDERPPGQDGRWELLRRSWDVLLPLLVAASIVLLAVRNGTYDATARGAFAIAVWWLLVLVLALGFLQRPRVSTGAWIAGGGLALLTVWAAVSIAWAPSAEDAVSVVDLDSLYLGVFALVTLMLGRRTFRAIYVGVALGIAAVVLLALLSRLFPSLGYAQSQLSALPVTERRLSFPIGYWNALAIFGGIGAPLVIQLATSARRWFLRGLLLAYVPALGGVLYLTSSRGGVAATVVALIVYLVLAERRALQAWAVALGAAGAAAAVAVLHSRTELLERPFGAAAASEGRSAFFAILAICIVVGAVFAVTAPLAARISTRTVDRLTLAAVVVVVIVGVAAANPVARIHDFKQAPPVSSKSQSYITAHLLSSSGNGRWQMWTQAIDEYAAHPAGGGGAGSYHLWWQMHRPTSLFVLNAHSLYLEALAELGIPGLLAIAIAMIVGGVGGIAGGLRRRGAHGAKLTALLAGFVAFGVGAGTDWIWQIPAVGAVGIAILALLAGGSWQPRLRQLDETASLAPLVARLSVIALCIVALGFEIVPLLARTQLDASAAAARKSDVRRALKNAAAARDLEPWAWSPYLQLALLEEQANSLPAARADIDRAIARNRSNWQLWLIAARVQTESGNIAGAKRSLAVARTLNPLGVAGLGRGS